MNSSSAMLSETSTPTPAVVPAGRLAHMSVGTSIDGQLANAGNAASAEGHGPSSGQTLIAGGGAGQQMFASGQTSGASDDAVLGEPSVTGEINSGGDELDEENLATALGDESVMASLANDDIQVPRDLNDQVRSFFYHSACLLSRSSLASLRFS